jgi:MYXO-CTERM domain-containing protein
MRSRLFWSSCLLASAITVQAASGGRALAANVALTVPDGVTVVRGLLACSSVGVGPGFCKSADFQDLAKRNQLGIILVTGENAFGPYANRCTGGEFKGVLDTIAKVGMTSNHPELANAPIVGIGHSHGGDYWNYFNACFPDRFALLFVKSAGGVQYTGAALRTPMVWEIGTNDLKNSMGHFRGDMFAHRTKGTVLSLVLGPGESHGGVTPGPRAMVATLVEAIFNLRVPEGADASKGPVTLNVIDESSGHYWLGDNYSKEISPYPASPDKDALYKTSFLPTEEIANKWKAAGAPLPTAITIATGGVCTTCYAHPASEPPGGPTMGGPQPLPADAGAPPADAGTAPDSAITTGPTPTPPVSPPSSPDPVPPAPRVGGQVTGGCAVATDGRSSGGVVLAVALAALLARRRRRSL